MNEMLGTGMITMSVATFGSDRLPVAEQLDKAEKITQVVNASSKIMLYEEEPRTIDDGNGKPPNFWSPTDQEQPSFLSPVHSIHGAYGTYGMWSMGSIQVVNPIPHGDAKGNSAMCDGSVQYISRKQHYTKQSFDPKS